ncbi:hypothetical protein EYB26_001927 [Talaromyces marneffei]|uniref:uncharacterized protein n=1 Tax=Talaromyces marneffei TaxID=37727 RepID=UPI0012A7997E|nr:uncharacterized protein EYB26_001927 [Talaromyces marneffei]QGA14274.1 hypothetical protein EYB26_001927 [Talaromyces marneffei]
MAEETLASAVSVPQAQELEPLPPLPDAGHKRRQSSVSETGTKRRRISVDGDRHQHERSPDNLNYDDNTRQSPSQQPTRPAGRKVAAAAEERKRGQRLFGGLLGTLSQSSATSAQKRRADIEQRQQAKLKLQDEQHSEKKRRRKEELVEERRRQQKELERVSMTVRHQNMLQSAGFLRTKVEPVLLWRPFELRAEDEDKVSKQRQEAKDTITREESEFEDRWRQREQEEENIRNENGKAPEVSNEPPLEPPAGKTRDTDKDTSNQSEKKAKEKGNGEPATDKGEQNTDATHHLSRHEDEGEEVMEEDKEDMVLY